MNKQNRWVRFWGGNSLLFTLLALGMIALVILLYSKISFIFQPLIVTLTTILPPIVFGLVLFYLLDPLIRYFEKFINRTWVISLIYIIILGLLIFGGIELIINARIQIDIFIRHFPKILHGFQHNIDNIFSSLPFTDEIRHYFTKFNWSDLKLNSSIEKYFRNGIQGFSGIFSTIGVIGLTIIMAPIIAFFLLRDKEKFFNYAKGIIPPNFRNDFNELAKIINDQVGGYLKGQIITCIILGLMYWPSFAIIGLPYAGILSLLAGVFSIIPYIGSFVAFLPGLIIGFQISFWMAVKFVIVWFLIQVIHGHFVVPPIMGKTVQLHTVTILLVLIVMGNLLGVIGIIFGIPIYCFIKAFVIYLFRKFKRRYNYFYGKSGKYKDTSFSKTKYLKK